MKKRIPSLDEYVVTLKTNGWGTKLADTLKTHPVVGKDPYSEISDTEIRSVIEIIANELGNAFRQRAFPFITDWLTYVILDIEDDTEQEDFETFLGEIGIQYDKTDKGYKVLITPENIQIAQNLIKNKI